MSEDNPEKLYLTCREVSGQYGGSPALWRLLALRKALPCYRLGQVILVFKREDVERYLESQPVTSPAKCRDGRAHGKRPGRRPLASTKA